MKKIALAIAMATSASFASAQLDFGPGAIEDQQSCVFTGDNGVVTNAACDTASYNFGLAAYNAAEDASNAADDVATSTQAVTDAQIAFDLVVPAQQGASQEAIDLAQAQNNLVTDNAAKAAADQTLANYQAIMGDVSSSAISYFEAEAAQQEKLDVQQEAATEEAAKANALDGFTQAVDAAEIVKDEELEDYTEAVNQLETAEANNAPQNEIDALNAAKNTAVQAFTDANDIYTDALADQATPLAEYNAAFEDLTTANDELDEANEALAGGQEAYTLLINEWTENVESTVDTAEFDLLVAIQQRDGEQDSLNNAQAVLSSEEGDFQTAQQAVATQQGVIDSADAAAEQAAIEEDQAQLAVDNATAEELEAAEAGLEAATIARIVAEELVISEEAALIPLNVAEDVAEADVVAAQAGVDAAASIVEASTDVAPFQAALDQLILDGADQADIDAAATLVNGSANIAGLTDELDQAIADQAVHSSYLDDQANPAGALMASLIESDTNAQEIVTAVSTNYDSTVENAVGISANFASIAANNTANSDGINSNENDITANSDLIAANADDITANGDLIAGNADDITANGNLIADNATAISDETDARVAADDVHTLAITANETAIATETVNRQADVLVLQNNINSNTASINSNTAAISTLSEDLDVVRSGVAATLAVAGMPLAPTEGWGAAIGTGYFDGESAVAAGLTFRSDRYNFKFAVGTSGGETTGSAGVSWGF